MKRTGFASERISGVLKDAEAGVDAVDVAWRDRVSEATI